jgi:hypothetical protein
MDLLVLALVLLAAMTHAAWNAWLKKTSPDFVGLGAISIGWLISGVVGLVFVGPSWSTLTATASSVSSSRSRAAPARCLWRWQPHTS